MKKHIILVSLDWERPQDGRSSLGIASIAASLKAAEVPYQVIEDAVNSPDFDYLSLERRVLETINKLEFSGHECLVGIGTFIWNEQQTQQLTKSVRTATTATLVLGGPQISYMALGQLELNYPFVDIFVRGHGEKAMVSLATENMYSSTGIHFSGTKDLGEKAEYSLNDLPSPWLTGILTPGQNIRWETMRGCPFRCSFCQHRESGNHFKIKEQQLDIFRIQNEVSLFAKSGVKRISILDPIFHLDTCRTVELLNQCRDVGLTAQLALQCRFESVKDEFLDALEGLDVVLEFGLQTAIQEEGELIGRPNRLDIAEKVIRKLKARNIPFEISLIYGLPEQTVESFRRSLAWCRSQGVPEIRAWPLMILRGTELDKQRENFGLVESTNEAIPYVIASNSFNQAEYLQMKALADASNILCITNEPEESNHGIFYRA